MKSNDGTYAQNALKHGVAGLHIDGGRIETDEIKVENDQYSEKGYWNTTRGKAPRHTGNGTSHIKGRFPANIILDEEAGRLLDEQSGILKSGGGNKRSTKPSLFIGKISHRELEKDYKSQGGASRFFYCAKSSKSERGEDNAHPTVKPLSLIEYLVKLTATPTNGTVLDPFAGSGTTGVACIKTGRSFVIIDKEIEYCEIGKHRIESESSQLRF